LATHELGHSQNLFYEVRYIEDDFQKKLENAVNYISSMHRRKMKKNPDISDEEARVIQGIIYCRKRETCDKVANALRAKGIMASAFHRGLTPKACDATCAQWLNAEELQRQGKRYVDVIGKLRT
jgi:superfamily II DNA helicase RecQ